MKIRKAENGRFVFFCPACKCGHWFNDTWQFNGDYEKPTISPSILVTRPPEPYRCHSFVTDGKLKFLDDCSHNLKGQIVDLNDF